MLQFRAKSFREAFCSLEPVGNYRAKKLAVCAFPVKFGRKPLEKFNVFAEIHKVLAFDFYALFTRPAAHQVHICQNLVAVILLCDF